jgi:hypothetical protein
MAQPDSILNVRGQSTDTLYGADGVARAKLGVGSKDVGLTPDAAWQGVATHMDGDDFITSDGIVVMGGIDGSDKARALAISADGGLTLTMLPSAGTLNDKSGTITTGDTAQTLAVVNADRRYLFIQNVDTSEDLWINFTTAAVKDEPSIKIEAGGSFTMEGSFVSTELVSVIAATTGHKWTAKEG